MAQIVPAILEQDESGFLDKVARVTKLAGCERIQVDFGDGQFISNKLLSVDEIKPLNPAFHWEAHLMIKTPRDFLDYQIVGFKTILVHYEAYGDTNELLKAIVSIKKHGLKPGVVVNPDTSVDVLRQFSEDVSHFLIMGVNPGYQGQAFIPETIERVTALRKLLPTAIIEVDGGVNADNVQQLAKAGADLLVVGSAIVKSPDMQEAWDKLNALILKPNENF
jgi:ribulose-phosphate 3-epimerase